MIRNESDQRRDVPSAAAAEASGAAATQAELAEPRFYGPVVWDLNPGLPHAADVPLTRLPR